jgi:hypothetical protein
MRDCLVGTIKNALVLTRKKKHDGQRSETQGRPAFQQREPLPRRRYLGSGGRTGVDPDGCGAGRAARSIGVPSHPGGANRKRRVHPAPPPAGWLAVPLPYPATGMHVHVAPGDVLPWRPRPFEVRLCVTAV